MQSSFIGKVQKAKQYAQEPERVRIDHMKLMFRGENGDHDVAYDEGRWQCTCNFFAGWGICCHTMAMERLLGEMIPVRQHYPEPLQQAEVAVAAGA